MDTVYSTGSDVTLVLTSCGLFDRLNLTLQSFLETNTYPAACILTEDSGDASSIDDTFKQFHCKADWQFYREGFIQGSETVLESAPAIIQAWLKNFLHDIRKKLHPSLGARELVGNTFFYRLKSNHQTWKGFYWNLGLSQLSDYKLLSHFSSLSKTPSTEVEHKAGLFYDRTIIRSPFWKTMPLTLEKTGKFSRS